MEEQVKARLIGATVLVVLIVLLVPELLSGPKNGTDAAADAKGKRGTRTYTIDLGAAAGEAARLEPAVAADTTRRPATTTLPTVAPPGAAAEQGGDKLNAAPAAATADATAPAAEPAPAKPAAAAPTAKSTGVPAPATTNTTPAATAAKAAPVAPTPAPSAQAAKPSTTPPQSETTRGGWAVQVGAFGSSDAARKVVAELERNGYHAYVAPLNRSGKTLYRVRVGPVAAKPDAEKLASRLKASGKSGTVVAAE